MIDNSCLKQIDLTDCQEIKNAGQKIVYQANSNKYGNVAVKIIKPNQNQDRILREIEIVQNNPTINTSIIYEHGYINCDSGKYIYILEEFIQGKNLRDCLDFSGTLPFDEVCKFLHAIIETIAVLEQNSIVHRDIKPENIMRKPDGQFLLIDFGIARDLSKTSLTDTSAPQGPATIIYAPIEQIDNEKDNIDSRTDLYSACLVAYEMISGSNPFSEGCENLPQVIRKIDKGIFKSLEDKYFNDLLEFIHTNMNRHRTRRTQNAAEAKVWFNEIYNKLCTEL